MLPEEISLPEGKKIYFASDFHLGVPTLAESQARERKIIRWLDSIQDDAAYIFLLGDVFDFWFEYRSVVPRGCTRFLGKLAQLTDQQIPIAMFSGNHDIWMWDYFPTELNIPIIHQPVSFTSAGKSFHVGHGDGLGPGDHLFKAVKKVFRNPFFQWCYARVHPNLGVGVAQYLSNRSRKSGGHKVDVFHGSEEWLIRYCEQIHDKQAHDFYLFGHRHLPMDITIRNTGRYINLGEWINHCTYAVFDGQQISFQAFEQTMPDLPSV